MACKKKVKKKRQGGAISPKFSKGGKPTKNK